MSFTPYTKIRKKELTEIFRSYKIFLEVKLTWNSQRLMTLKLICSILNPSTNFHQPFFFFLTLFIRSLCLDRFLHVAIWSASNTHSCISGGISYHRGAHRQVGSCHGTGKALENIFTSQTRTSGFDFWKSESKSWKVMEGKEEDITKSFFHDVDDDQYLRHFLTINNPPFFQSLNFQSSYFLSHHPILKLTNYTPSIGHLNQKNEEWEKLNLPSMFDSHTDSTLIVTGAIIFVLKLFPFQ